MALSSLPKIMEMFTDRLEEGPIRANLYLYRFSAPADLRTSGETISSYILVRYLAIKLVMTFGAISHIDFTTEPKTSWESISIVNIFS